MNRIEIKSKEDRLTAVKILADNGYTVRIISGVKEGSKMKTMFVEYWRNNNEKWDN